MVWGGSTRPVASFLLQAEQLLVRGTQQLRHAGHGRTPVAVLCAGELVVLDAVPLVLDVKLHTHVSLVAVRCVIWRSSS